MAPKSPMNRDAGGGGPSSGGGGFGGGNLGGPANGSAGSCGFSGRSGTPIEIARGTNSPTQIMGRQYSGHALDRMQGRGFTPSLVENTINTGTMKIQPSGDMQFFEPVNNINVILDLLGTVVITVRPGRLGR